MTIVIVAAVMTTAQIVAVGTLPGLAVSKTPLIDAAAAFLGPGGAAMITIGAVISASGNNMGGALSGSRNLFALAEQGDLPSFFGRVHPRYRTPVNAYKRGRTLAVVILYGERSDWVKNLRRDPLVTVEIGAGKFQALPHQLG